MTLLADIQRRRDLEKIRGKAKQHSSSSSSSSEGPTLNEVLRARGFTTSPAAPGRKNVLDGSGRIVLENVHAGEVWDWLRTGARPSSPARSRPKKKRKAKKAAAKPKAKPKKKRKKAKAKKRPKPKKKKAKAKRAKAKKKAR